MDQMSIKRFKKSAERAASLPPFHDQIMEIFVSIFVYAFFRTAVLGFFAVANKHDF
jgi:hypothetical protein